MEFNFDCNVDFDADLKFDVDEPSFTFDESESSSFHQIVCDTRRDTSDQEPIQTFPFYFGNKCPYTDVDFIINYQATQRKRAREATKEAATKEAATKEAANEAANEAAKKVKRARLSRKKNNKKIKKSDLDAFLNFRTIAPKCM